MTGFLDLRGLLTVRPLPALYAWPAGDPPVRSPFWAQWGATVRLLANELRAVGAESAVLLMELGPGDLRNDGFPRADTNPRSPGVVLNFTHPAAGPLSYPCNRYQHWQDNVRAIALGLQALRAVDRYGITVRSEQYRGWRALPASTEGPMDTLEAARVLVAESGLPYEGEGALARAVLDVVRDAPLRARLAREALKRTHPDGGGNADAFHRVQRARQAFAE